MRAAILACLIVPTTVTPAHASCTFATIPQEFRTSKWVVRARVESADDHWANGDESWTTYTVRVLHRYKGPPAKTLRVFTFRDSGGFYLDKGTLPDLDRDYLLFLVPSMQTLPRGVRNVTQVNFDCGQSKPIGEVSSTDLKLLDRLASRSRR